MLTEKFEIFLALFAGLIILVMGFFLTFTLPEILLRLLIVLVVFYIIGLAAKTYLRRRIFVEPEAVEEPAEETSDDTVAAAEAVEIENNADNQPV